MDELTFRRRIYADPQDSGADIKEACISDPKKAKFKAELLDFDEKINRAMFVDVPDNLAERILLNKHIQNQNNIAKKRKTHWLVAASVIFSVGLGSVFFNINKSTNQLVTHALMHMQSELDHIPTEGSYTLAQVNAKLAEFGGTLIDNIGTIKFVSFCRFEGTRSLHIVMTDEGKDVTVFVVPKSSGLLAQSDINDGNYYGTSVSEANADLVVITPDSSTANSLKQKLISKINWQKA